MLEAARLVYWQEQFARELPILDLPTDFPRSTQIDYTFQYVHKNLSVNLLPQLQQLACTEDTTPFIVLLTSYLILLYRYTGQTDIIIGTQIDNSLLPLRIKCSGNSSFRDLIKRVVKVTQDSLVHQPLSWTELIESLNLPEPLRLQTGFALREACAKGKDLEENKYLSPFPLTLDIAFFVESPNTEPQLMVVYNSKLFMEASMQRLLGHYQTLFTSALANSDIPLSELPLLTTTEHIQLQAWNNTTTTYPHQATLTELFAAQVIKTPDNVALVFRDESLSYAQLNERANQLAHYLQKTGIGPDILVGLCVERSLDMIIGLLGILKAGAAYLPLDPTYPSERLAYMLTDSAVPVLLTQSSLLDQLPPYPGHIICLDTDRAAIAQESMEPPISTVAADNLAYVIYTSGSTGRPKGVLVPHRGLINVSYAQQHIFGLSATDHILQFSSLSFDASAYEIMMALTAGATLYVDKKETLLPGPGLLRVLQENHITRMIIPPAALEALPLTDLPDLQTIGVAGETCPVHLPQQWGQKRAFYNLYGPTETTIWATAALCDPTLASSPSIGRPILNTQIYILDKHWQLTPIGVPGELCIGGISVTRGYLGHSGLTADRFIPDPFSNTPGTRLYRTGDLARYLPDGNIEFLGRLDHQIKVRGFRIELGEIEATLEQHAGIQRAVVLLHEDTPHHNQLVAYIMPHSTGEPLTPTAIRDYLHSQLPDYMIPIHYIFLNAFPLTSSGKINRRALPAPEHDRDTDITHPRTFVETTLAAIWSQVLGIEEIGVHDNFLELGGHSLLAVRVMTRLNEHFGSKLTVRVLFDAPTIAMLSQHIEAERELKTLPIEPVSRQQPLLLSSAQQRLWFINQLDPDSPAYLIPIAYRISGALDVAVLEQSLNTIIARHEALRTAFVSQSGQTYQVIAPTLQLPLNIIDLSHLPKAAQETKVQQILFDESQRPFDLTHLPLLRVHLLYLAPQDHILLIVIHHVVFDEWSLDVFFQEMSVLYPAFIQGESSPLPELSIQYADFALWQSHWLRGKTLDIYLSYWERQLANMPAVLALPADYPHLPVQTYQGAQCHRALPIPLTQKLEALSRQEEVTLFMTLLAAFKVLLSRYTNRQDIVVGSPIANRNHSEIENLIGFFVNTLVLRTDLSGEITFQALLQRVYQMSLAAYAHQELPFDLLVEKLQPERDQSHHPLFQVLFSFQSLQTTALQIGNLQLTPLRIDNKTAKFDLSLIVTYDNQGLICTAEYNTNLFREATITRFLGHYQTLLQSIVNDPQQRLSELTLLSDSERQQLLTTWNDTAVSYPNNKTIPQFFEEQVVQTPNAVAVVSAEQTLTYSELNSRANQLAYHLQSLGVQSETFISVFMDRTPDIIVSLLAILKAGGAYVPLDPTYPAERVNFTLQDTSTQIVLTQETLAAQLKTTVSIPHVIPVDTLDETLSTYPCTNPRTSTTAQNLAYLIYTSGSTGRPKGVAITHQNAVAMIAWAQDIYPPAVLQGVAGVTSICFDLSVYEIFLPLSVGGTIILAVNALEIPKLPQREQITLINTVPSVMTTLIQTQAIPESVQVVNLAGEPLPRALVQQIYQHSMVQQVYNLYGPSEDTTYSTWISIDRTDPNEPTIGHPLYNTQAYILDTNLQPVPIGIPGELYLGGDGVSRGYLNRPALTAARYIPNPFADLQLSDADANQRLRVSNLRLYRTGDLARFLPDGRIQYLGRSDFQVKIRGHRIELGEVEVALSRHPDVLNVVVMALDAPGDTKQLVAYLTTATDVTPDALHNFLSESLPGFMVPSAFVLLDEIPLTPNGKINRKALPRPIPATTDAYSAPRTPTEIAIAAVWSELIGVKHISIHDNFFALGGHSLLAMQVISRLRQALNTDIALRQLFEQPTVMALANAIDAVASITSIPPIIPIDRSQLIPLSFAQQRLWFLDQLEEQNVAYNVPVALRLRGPLDVTLLTQSFQAVVARHENLRTTFTMQDGLAVQVIHTIAERPFHLRHVALQQLPCTVREAELLQLARAEARIPFDLSEGPLLRATLAVLAPDEYALLINVHHIIFDEWSSYILIGEVMTVYEALRQNQPIPLPDLPVQYADYALWQRNWLVGNEYERQLAYWREQLHVLPILELPTDFPRSPVMRFNGAVAEFIFPPDLLQAAKAASQAQDTTLFMFMMTIFKLLLSRYTQSSDIVLGSPVANRPLTEMQNLIGIFLNTLVFRTKLDGVAHFHEALARVRQTCVDAYAHQDLPFENLVSALQPARDLSRTPLFQVLFVFTSEYETITAPDLSMDPFVVDTGTAKFDLSLFLNETPSGMYGAIEYSTDLFKETTIQRMWGHLLTLLTAVLQNPTQPISTLPLLTTIEQQQITQWNQTKVNYAYQGPIHGLFEQQVQRRPDAVAVEFGTQTLTYRQLDAKANQLARYLQARGIGPDIPVAVGLDRSVEMIIAILGTLKAGGVYLPLDPTYPAERLAFMLSDAGAPMLLTQSSLCDIFTAQMTKTDQILCLDTEWQQVAGLPATSITETAVTANNLLYLLYTSGSTGKPKGVAMRHGPLTNLVQWQMAHTVLSEPARTLQFSSISFDVSCQELFFTWHSGGTLVLIDDTTRRDTASLLDFLHEQRIERLFIPFIGLQYLAEVAQTHDLTDFALQEVITAGEQLQVTPALVHFFTALGNCTLHNQYGPTESHVATAYTLTGTPNTWTALPPIGTPVANANIEILDKHYQRVPIGVPGELYIGGDILARGYLNQPDLTKERFLNLQLMDDDLQANHPFYKTGDLARYLPDGNIEYLGRNDFQVKVRGYRIEPGEIETTLMQHPAVREVVIKVWTDRNEQRRLVAYVVPETNREKGDLVIQLQVFLRERMPAYMVPERWLLLDRFPTTPSGKIDRRALPDPGEHQLGLTSFYIAPRTHIEEILTELWEQALGVRPISVHDNFFELGGHSLLVVQIINQLNQLVGYKFSTRALFDMPTIAQLAQHVEETIYSKQRQHVTTIQPTTKEDVVPLSFMQQSLWLINQLEPGNIAYHTYYLLHLVGNLDVNVLCKSFNKIVQRHDALRTTFDIVNNQPIQVIAPALTIPLPIIDLQQHPTNLRLEQARQVAREQIRQPFDLAHGPLIRTTLLQLSLTEYILIVNLHHIVTDGWSFNILFTELSEHYKVLINKAPLSLPPLPIQYKDFAIWQRQQMQEGALDNEIAYWRKQLNNMPDALQLFVERERPLQRTYQGAELSLIISKSLSDQIEVFSRQENATTFIVLLATFKVLLHLYSGETDIIVGSPVANRNHTETQNLIGYFVNLLALRTQLVGSFTFRELVEDVRETTLAAYAHHELPFQQLVEILQPERKKGYHPIFQAVFTFQNAPLVTPVLPSLDIELMTLDIGVIQFDIAFYLAKTEQGLVGVIGYRTDLFDETIIVQMQEQYQILLKTLVNNPDQVLSTLLSPMKEDIRQFSNEIALQIHKTSTVSVPAPQNSLAQRKAALSERREKLSSVEQSLLDELLRGEN